ncbi:choice-of-anchor Q domain-containing protein [Fimbriiglobus ruber]|uniref:choice-of-anchor Q domain-containing protein n=1 Tax=Fimbriiglobus ruber TaxID=1908690 RepID=UPI000B4BBD56|nr:choice-of-anchor Q domain-containing protein [Fimbriiglobus ruber]
MSSRSNHWWLKPLFRTGPIPAGPTRLRAETLEDRTTPAAFTVNSFTDDGSAGTLRSVLDQVNADASSAADTITFTRPGTVTLTQGQLEISRTSGPVTIDGGGNAVAVSGGGTSRVFEVDGGVTATLTGLTIENGNAVSSGGGGGVFVAGGMATITDATITDNTAGGTGGGGGVLVGGGMATITDTTLTDNTAGNGGGGGVAVDGGTATITDTTLTSNTAGDGGGVDDVSGAVAITGSTLADNHADNGYGGGVEVENGTVTITDTTITGNTANYGGGVDDFAGATITDSTVTGNTASSDGSGVLCQLSFPGDSMDIAGSIVSGNTGGKDLSDSEGFFGFTDGGYNLFGTAVGGTATGDVSSDTPGLAPLGDYGGPTRTMAILPGSPALDAGNPADSSPDQRGVFVQNQTRDIGAFESRGFTLTPAASGTPQSAPVGTAFAQPLAVAVAADDPGLTDLSGGVVMFAAPATGATAALSATSVTLTSTDSASVTATANGAVGSYRATASAGGNPAYTAAFHLTNDNDEAPSLVVTTTADIVDPTDGLTSLREALTYADTFTTGTPTITFDPTVFDGAQMPIILGGTQLEITNTTVPVTIDGTANGAAGVTVSGSDTSRVFQVDGGVTTALTGLTIEDGDATSGGGVYVAGTVTITDGTITGNTASFSGGGVEVLSGGAATITDSTITGNITDDTGGGVEVDGGSVTITGSTLSDNHADNGEGGGVCVFGGSATITDTTITNNTADDGGGVDVELGGAWSRSPTPSLATPPVMTVVACASTVGRPQSPTAPSPATPPAATAAACTTTSG